METVIYVDTLFLINFIMDGLCLAVTMVLLSKRLVAWRFLCACTLGGIYSFAVLLIETSHPILSVLMHLAAAFVICLIAIGWKSFNLAVYNTVCFFFVNAALGGILYAVYTLCGCFVMYNGAFYAELSAPALIASGVICATVLLFCFTKYKARNVAAYCDLRIFFRGKCCTASCMVDSGNLLTCPYTALPVAIISGKAAKYLFTDEELTSLAATPAMERVRPLPAKGIGGDTLLPSFIPERAEICSFGKKSFEEKQICIAVRLGSGSFGGCDGVVPASIL